MFSPCLDVRDYGVRPDSGDDCTLGFTQAFLDAGKRGYPNQVFAPAGLYLVGPLVFPSPGIGLVGQGKMGMSSNNCRATIFVERDFPSDSGPAISIDAGKMQSSDANSFFGWGRGCSVQNIGIDVSQCKRFLTDAPPSVVGFYGISNSGPFQDIVVYGNRGTAYDFRSNYNPQFAASGALCENLTLRDCYSYGGYLPGGAAASYTPSGPAVYVLGSDNITIDGGLFAFNNANLPLPISNNPVTDIPAILFETDAITGNACSNGCTVRGAAITNYVQSIRTKGAQCKDGWWRWPQNVVIDNPLVENFHDALVFNIEQVPSNTWSFFRTRVLVSAYRLGGSFGWYGDGHQVLADWIQGGFLDLQFMGAPGGRMSGDVTLGANTDGVRCRVGPNPNGNAPRGIDMTNGRNRFDYLDV